MIAAALMLTMSMLAQTDLPKPSTRQLEWQRMERYAFVHFGPNTFTGREWGEGREDPKVFNPTNLDTRQWVRSFRSAGFTGVILTAKHHDGFCLWPSKYSTHTVAQSPWRGGKGDLLKELSQACREGGLKLGVYLSPWDRNHPAYGTPEYNTVFANMLREVLTNYGPIFEVWFDGANGEGPNGKRQVYDWDLFNRTVRELQPKASIFGDGGPDVRWVGNESGVAGETNWSTIDARRFTPGNADLAALNAGHAAGPMWLPAECDVSIRPGWFYHAAEDDKVKGPLVLEDLYLKSVGRNGSLLLNVPPDTRGLVHEADVRALEGFGKRIAEVYGKDLARGAGRTALTDGKPDTFVQADRPLTLELGKAITFDRVEVREPIAQGQRVAGFRVEVRADGEWSEVARGTTVGNRRILPIHAVRGDAVRVSVTESVAPPLLSALSLYCTPEGAREQVPETPAQRDRRMGWWREARFGMFIHWGLYSIPAGEWNGKVYGGASEWLMNTAGIPVADYAPLKDRFNPVRFDAKRWVQIAKDAGMRYIVITSKHHEGFAMWPSKQGDFNIGNTGFGRDPLKELAKACQEAGIRLCFYHSIMDWHHPDHVPHEAWDKRPSDNADYERYVRYMKAQLKELLTDYGPIGILWFDGEWKSTWNHERGKDLYKYVRGLQPSLIVNNRVDVGRSGMEGTSDAANVGDYGTPEQEIPANGMPGLDWESCMTMNDSWGYHATDTNWKSAETLIRNVVDCASKGGNYLLNVGPTSLGEIPEASIERLAAVGKWMRRNGEAVYGTSASPFPKALGWGRVTRKGNLLYLCVFDKGATRVELPGLEASVNRAYALDGGVARVVTPTGDGYEVEVGPSTDEPVRVVVVETQGVMKAHATPTRQASDGTVDLGAADAKVNGKTARLEARTDAIGFWTDPLDTVAWEFVVTRAGRYRAEAEFACEPASAGSVVEFLLGESKLVATIPSTGSWTTFERRELGVFDVPAAGNLRLVVRPLNVPNGGVMNLRRVRLSPAG